MSHAAASVAWWGTIPALLTVFLVLISASGHAQGTESAPGTATVAGRVFCADTQKPARFALVRLQAVESGQPRGGVTTTGADGSFSLSSVSPGDYYVDVTLAGYIEPLRGHGTDLQQLPPAERDRLLAQLTRISVQANQPVTSQVTIYRGATISGTVLFDDGSPAASLQVQPSPAQPDAAVGNQVSTTTARRLTGTPTDDRGQYRITGLADGVYTVSVLPRSLFPIYYGNTIDAHNAKKVELHGSDEAAGVDIQVPANGMHRVTGVVIAAGDGHPVARAILRLQIAAGDGADAGSAGEASIAAISAADGSFTFSAVPDGSFILETSGGFDSAIHAAYRDQSEPVAVSGSDTTDLVLRVAFR